MTVTQDAAMVARLNDERALIFRNLVNGVSASQVMQTFRKSEKEVMDIFRFVCRKITEYCFRNRMPAVFCDALSVAKQNRIVLLTLLPRVNLDKAPVLCAVKNEHIDAGNITSAFKDMLVKA